MRGRGWHCWIPWLKAYNSWLSKAFERPKKGPKNDFASVAREGAFICLLLDEFEKFDKYVDWFRVFACLFVRLLLDEFEKFDKYVDWFRVFVCLSVRLLLDEFEKFDKYVDW